MSRLATRTDLALVRFRAAAGECAVPVDRTVLIRRVGDVAGLPSPRAGVVGYLPYEGEAVPVVSLLSSEGHYLLLLDTALGRLALVVDEVTGVIDVPAADVGPAPHGQAQPFASGTLRAGDDLVLVVDVDAIARSLA